MHKLLKILITSTIVFSGCAHTTPPIVPPSAGYYGTRDAQTPVLCVIDADFTPERCRETVEAAITVINNTIGREALHFAGGIQITDASQVPEPDENVILVGVDTLPDRTLGLTSPRGMDGPKLRLTVIVLSEQAWKIGRAPDVALHEMLHAMGIAHADAASRYSSLMKPSIGEQHGLSPADIVTLRAAYK